MDLADLLTIVFPTGQVGFLDDRLGSFEINGLATDAEPQGCTILARGQERYAATGERREHFFIQVQDRLMFFRICSAAPGSGYAAFATGRGGAVDVADTERAAEMHDYAHRTLTQLCD